MTVPNHYKTLGLTLRATQEEVRASFIKKAQQTHPDKGGDAGEFTRLHSAYDVLKDQKKRYNYNAQLLASLPACRGCTGKGAKKRTLRGQHHPVYEKCEGCDGVGVVWPLKNGDGK